MNEFFPTLKNNIIPYDYQNDTCKWMEKQEYLNPNSNFGIQGGIICLNMGMGKTLIGLLHTFSQQIKKDEKFPTLVLVSKTVMYEWKKNGASKFFDHAKVLYFHKDFMGSYIDKITTNEILTYRIIVTTYDVCVSICKKENIDELICKYGVIKQRNRPSLNDEQYKGKINLYKIPWERIFADESQRFANPKTYTYKAIMALYGKYKWCLTGTPIRNYTTDIWSQLRFCGYWFVDRAKDWKQSYFHKQNLRKHIYYSDYKIVNLKMPKKITHYYLVKLKDENLKIYEAILVLAKEVYSEFAMKIGAYVCVLTMLLRLRQTAIAPYIIIAPKRTKTQIDDRLYKSLGQNNLEKWCKDIDGTAGLNSPKIEKIIEIIQNEIPRNEKIILFSMFTSCLDMVKYALDKKLSNYKINILDGRTTGEERYGIIDSFKDGNIDILLVHYKVGGEGLNLIEANHVICIEPWWSPAVHNQGIARAWRRGQEKDVHVHWVLVEDTIEKKILDLCDFKMDLSDSYLHGEINERTTGLDVFQLKKILDIE